jgi:alpha-ketoglutarate-dependent taurine dioxygenase
MSKNAELISWCKKPPPIPQPRASTDRRCLLRWLKNSVDNARLNYPLGPGAELRGVTLADVAADDAAYRETRAAFEEHSVLVLRGQDVGDEAQLAFSRRFGPLEVTKVDSLGVGTNLVILSTIDENGKVVPADHRLALRNKANQLWHTDSTFKRVPALASVLSARVIPARGGETEYVSTRLAWERSTRPSACGSKMHSLGTIMPIHAARSRPTSRAPRSARRCRRNAGAWCGRTL